METTIEQLKTKYQAILSKADLIGKKTELKTLEEIKGKKVDHAPGQSKDIADAVAGVVYNCISRTSDFGFILAKK